MTKSPSWEGRLRRPPPTTIMCHPPVPACTAKPFAVPTWPPCVAHAISYSASVHLAAKVSSKSQQQGMHFVNICPVSTCSHSVASSMHCPTISHAFITLCSCRHPLLATPTCLHPTSIRVPVCQAIANMLVVLCNAHVLLCNVQRLKHVVC